MTAALEQNRTELVNIADSRLSLEHCASKFARQLLLLLDDEYSLHKPDLASLHSTLFTTLQSLHEPPVMWHGTDAIYRWLESYVTTNNEILKKYLNCLAVRFRACCNDMFPSLQQQQQQHTIQVYVRLPTDRLIGPFSCEDSVDALKQQIYRAKGIPIDQQRLRFAGKQLGNDKRLSDHGLRTTVTSRIYLVLRMRGMISTFDSADSSDPLVAYLSTIPNGPSHCPDEAVRRLLHEKAKAQGAVTNAYGYTYSPDTGILRPYHLDMLSRLVDHVWERQHDPASTTEVDMRMVISRPLMLSLFKQYERVANGFLEQDECRRINVYADEIVQLLQRLHSGRHPKKFAFRRTQGPTDACINFHCDGDGAYETVQITLNDGSEYDGGRLVYFCNNGRLEVPPRSKGAMTCHGRSVFHAVTPLRSGVRKNLFIVDMSNELGEERHGDIHTIDNDDITTFINRDHICCRNTTNTQEDVHRHDTHEPEPGEVNLQFECVICMDRARAYVILPCGHLCICGVCKGSVGQCPICRANIMQIKRVYF